MLLFFTELRILHKSVMEKTELEHVVQDDSPNDEDEVEHSVENPDTPLETIEKNRELEIITNEEGIETLEKNKELETILQDEDEEMEDDLQDVGAILDDNKDSIISYEEVEIIKQVEKRDGTIDALAMMFDRLLPKKKLHVNILLDEDLIPKESSIQRLEWMMVFSAIIMSLSSLVMSIDLCIKIFDINQPLVHRVREPPNQFWRAFPTLHLALIDVNATVHDVSFKEAISASRKKLLRLPMPPYYLGYSDEKGVLYFIPGKKGRNKITKFHPALNKNGHITVPFQKKWNSKSDSFHDLFNRPDYIFTKSSLIGHYFWFYSLQPSIGFPESSNYEPFSGIWNTKKLAAFSGPNLYPEYSGDVFNLEGFFCSAALNASHVMIIGLQQPIGDIFHESQTMIMDIETSRIVIIKDIGISFYDCLATLTFNKNGDRIVFAQLELRSNVKRFATYNLAESGPWTVIESHASFLKSSKISKFLRKSIPVF